MAWGWDFNQQWGIYDQTGNPILQADSVFSVEYLNTYRISDYPQEQGAFASYNKVKVPFTTKITYLVGDQTDKPGFLNALESASASLDLFVVATPDISYPSANIVFFNYRRTGAQGAQLIRVEVWCEEVRVVQTGQLSNTQSTNGQQSQNGGTVQTIPTGPNGSDNLVSDIPNPTVPPETTVTTTPISVNMFSLPSDLPQVPNVYNNLSTAQQSAVTNFGFSNNASTAQVFQPDSSGNVSAVFY